MQILPSSSLDLGGRQWVSITFLEANELENSERN